MGRLVINYEKILEVPIDWNFTGTFVFTSLFEIYCLAGNDALALSYRKRLAAI